jgi:hypothetical protein
VFTFLNKKIEFSNYLNRNPKKRRGHNRRHKKRQRLYNKNKNNKHIDWSLLMGKHVDLLNKIDSNNINNNEQFSLFDFVFKKSDNDINNDLSKLKKNILSICGKVDLNLNETKTKTPAFVTQMNYLTQIRHNMNTLINEVRSLDENKEELVINSDILNYCEEYLIYNALQSKAFVKLNIKDYLLTTFDGTGHLASICPRRDLYRLSKLTNTQLNHDENTHSNHSNNNTTLNQCLHLMKEQKLLIY